MPTIILRVKHKGQVISRTLFDFDARDVAEFLKVPQENLVSEYVIESVIRIQSDLKKFSKMRENDAYKCAISVLTYGISISSSFNDHTVEVLYRK